MAVLCCEWANPFGNHVVVVAPCCELLKLKPFFFFLSIIPAFNTSFNVDVVDFSSLDVSFIFSSSCC
jgi:hypothetical protein